MVSQLDRRVVRVSDEAGRARTPDVAALNLALVLVYEKMLPDLGSTLEFDPLNFILRG